MSELTEKLDSLDALYRALPLQEKLVAAHRSMQEMFPFIARIAVSIFDPQTNTLKTYLHSSGGDAPLGRYEASLDDAPSLQAILEKGLPRVINNPITFEDSDSEHTRRIGRAGYAASYTLPMFNEGSFIGFIFFNAIGAIGGTVLGIMLYEYYQYQNWRFAWQAARGYLLGTLASLIIRFGMSVGMVAFFFWQAA